MPGIHAGSSFYVLCSAALNPEANSSFSGTSDKGLSVTPTVARAMLVLDNSWAAAEVPRSTFCTQPLLMRFLVNSMHPSKVHGGPVKIFTNSLRVNDRFSLIPSSLATPTSPPLS
eukprot:CAMPEP_0114323462 /NCGR_PEP_ID=MMETSP0059-20121206/27890_1 /TAXON_ID=36894 /ORGANISM="Pyramimonas parkeae, Strain CCMP726" /LENGTH=114 /DNA_ID=CAMNT_0001451743 /DNA_START=214 /DNA_END=558 /DNA_ORIENTATION=+